MTISISPIPALKDNYIWTMIDYDKKTAVIVDPGEAGPVKDFLEQQQLKLLGILITHHHWDHTNGIAELKKMFAVPVIAPAKEKVATATITVNDDDTAQIPNFPLTFKVIAIPGHTLGHSAYYGNDILFCGDTLFAAGCGRIFEGTPPQMYNSLQKLAALPAHTKMYCGHEYTLNNLKFAKVVEPGNQRIDERIDTVTTARNQKLPSLPALMADELATNPFLRCHSDEIIANVSDHVGQALQDPIDVFAALRKWKDNF